MEWTQIPQTDKDLAPVYTRDGWVLRCWQSSHDFAIWIIERHNRAPITTIQGGSALFLGLITISDDHKPNIFDLASALIDKHELSIH